ncbi:hypothetical protein GCM10016272_07320 [Psychrobacter glaciei]|uniref:DUF4124 domain-containing protein n=1 Tax=Psychrobacter glaciei TaxID=619771 RepID=A0ABQ3GNF1_9GAMM|nr:DUF4124 domain-containing protein [Psychrobacter glaciei]GHD28237.1 hypothetical protein GCM10016272_07320 [Psychrobacter glaciei]
MISLSKLNVSKGHVKVGLLTITAIASLCAPLANAAPIYKVVDEQTGQVTFTDRPQSYEQQVGKQVSQTTVTTGNGTSGSNNNSTRDNQTATNATQTASIPATNDATVKAPINYQLAITEPSEERAYRRPAQSINVALQIKPALQAGDSVRIYFDGNEVAQGLNATIATIDALPGAHTITAVIQSVKGQTLQQAARTVYVIQNNTTLQNNKKIAKQLLAYQNLPWHQKVMLKLRQQDGSLQKVQSNQSITNDAFTK